MNVYKQILARPEQPVALRTPHQPWPTKNEPSTAILRTCHQIYDEAYPILHSANAWVIYPAREESEWLVDLGLQGLNALRKLTFKADYDTGDTNLVSILVFSILPICQRLELTISSYTWHFLLHYKTGQLAFVHGFAKATMDELSNEPNSCCEHSNLPGVWTADLAAQRDRTWKALLEHFISACPEDCKMHAGRPASHTKSTIRLSLFSSCFDCEKGFHQSGRAVVHSLPGRATHVLPSFGLKAPPSSPLVSPSLPPQDLSRSSSPSRPVPLLL